MLERQITAPRLRLCGAAALATTLIGGILLAGTSTETSAAQQLNCASVPSKCGYPDATNTGMKDAETIIKKIKVKVKPKKKKNKKKKKKVKYKWKTIVVTEKIDIKSVPSEVKSGQGWRWDSRGWVAITGDGAVFSNYRVEGNVDVQADNVVIKNVEIIRSGEDFGISLRHTNNTVIENCTIHPAPNKTRLMVGIKDIYGDAKNTRISKCNISGTSTGIQIYRGIIEHNYIHDMGYKSGDHINGITTNGSKDSLRIYHNTIFNQISQTDAIGLFQDFGLEANRTIDSNFLAGGGYTLYAGQNPGKAATYNIKVLNNRFSRVFYPNGGYYGPATAYNRNGSGNEWVNNYWDDTGKEIRAP